MKNAFRSALAAVAFIPLLTAPRVGFAAENCVNCHNGSDPDAPNVYAYWDGSFWGADTLQKGGHGDPGGKPARTCTGALGCHEIDAVRHENGILETAGNPSLNTSQLKAFFISSVKNPAFAAAQTFNTACATACHPAEGVGICAGAEGGHDAQSGIPYTPLFGVGLTPADADGSNGPRATALWLDSDISTQASRADPDHGVCVSCHDPHGTAVVEPSRESNMMLREHFFSNISGNDHLCIECHLSLESPPLPPAPLSAGDGVYSNRTVLTWPDVAGEDGYRIYRASHPNGPYSILATKGADQTSYADTGLVCGDAYFYRVSSYRGGFESSLSPWDVGSPCNPATGSISGSVQTAGGRPLGGADVLVYSGPGTMVRTGRTSADGTFSVYGIPPGTYRVMFRGERVQFGSRWYDATAGYENALPVAVLDEKTTPGISATLTAKGDWDADDKPDIFWENTATGETRVWLMKGRSLAGTVSLDRMTEKGWEAAAVADFDGDGRPDIFWRNYRSGRNTIWFTNGTAVTRKLPVKRVGDTSWRVAAAGDVDGDGRADLLWRNIPLGRSIFSLLDGAKLRGLLPAPQQKDGDWKAGATADFDGDGHVDLFWRNTATGANMVWLMTRNELAATVALQSVPLLSWGMYQAGDFNGDGAADMIWRNASAGANIIAHFDGTDLLGVKGIPKEKNSSWVIRQ